MLINLLEEAATTTPEAGSPIPSYILLAVVAVAFIVFLFFSNRKAKKREQETKNMLDAIQPGNKVKTIGGVCGIVVEVNAEENTFVLETGSEVKGKSYIKFDKAAVYQTDAKPQEEPKKEKKEEASAAPTVDGEEVK